MDSTYASALNYILRKTAPKGKGKVSGLSTSGFPTPLSSDVKPIIADEQLRSVNVKLRVDEYLEKRYNLDDHELAEMYKKLTDELYIYEDKKSQLIKITFKGLDFINEGGFVKKEAKEKDKAFYTMAVVIFFIIGAIALAVIELLKYTHS